MPFSPYSFLELPIWPCHRALTEPILRLDIQTKLDQYEKRLLELNQFNEKMTREHNEKVGVCTWLLTPSMLQRYHPGVVRLTYGR